MSIKADIFGKLNGTDTYSYTLSNGCITAQILSYGGIVRKLCVPDSKGNMVDVVLGRDTIGEYLTNDGYLGALIGRHANRIAASSFTLNGKKYEVGKNEGQNSLHGGVNGFDKKEWSAVLNDGEEPSLTLAITSPDGEEGFPGRLSVVVTYTITKDNALKINYRAKTDKDTVINMTNHSYFNLAGHGSGKMTDQTLKINASFYTPNNAECMPTGEILSVEGTPFDFRTAKTIGKDINDDCEQIKMFGGYDHNFVIDGTGYRKFAEAVCTQNGICMEVYSDKPAMQLYTSNALNEGTYKDGAKYGTHQAFCLETQYFPNSMANTHFPSPVLRTDEEYNYTTEYRFSVRED